jgi:hypothetical protein
MTRQNSPTHLQHRTPVVLCFAIDGGIPGDVYMDECSPPSNAALGFLGCLVELPRSERKPRYKIYTQRWQPAELPAC